MPVRLSKRLFRLVSNGVEYRRSYRLEPLEELCLEAHSWVEEYIGGRWRRVEAALAGGR